VTGSAPEVESVTLRLAAELAHIAAKTRILADHLSEVEGRWSRSRKAWAFAIGLATVVGGIATVLALFIH
jgi:hypothetical protein